MKTFELFCKGCCGDLGTKNNCCRHFIHKKDLCWHYWHLVTYVHWGQWDFTRLCLHFVAFLAKEYQFCHDVVSEQSFLICNGMVWCINGPNEKKHVRQEVNCTITTHNCLMCKTQWATIKHVLCSASNYTFTLNNGDYSLCIFIHLHMFTCWLINSLKKQVWTGYHLYLSSTEGQMVDLHTIYQMTKWTSEYV